MKERYRKIIKEHIDMIDDEAYLKLLYSFINAYHKTKSKKQSKIEKS